MGSTVVTKVIAAVAVTLVVDLTERALDQMGISKDTAKLPREIIKAVAGVVSGILMESILKRSTDSATAASEVVPPASSA